MGDIRILSGSLKGRVIYTPNTTGIRPTQSKVRAALFNSLQHDIEGAIFLDICAGSGSMGIEALSRGAKSAIFIEQDRKAIAVIEKNVAALHLENQTRILAAGALDAIHRLLDEEKTVDIIYFDPPYGKGLTSLVIHAVDTSPKLLASGGYFIVEERKGFIIDTLQNLSLQKIKHYGDSLLFIFMRS